MPENPQQVSYSIRGISFRCLQIISSYEHSVHAISLLDWPINENTSCRVTEDAKVIVAFCAKLRKSLRGGRELCKPFDHDLPVVGFEWWNKNSFLTPRYVSQISSPDDCAVVDYSGRSAVGLSDNYTRNFWPIGPWHSIVNQSWLAAFLYLSIDMSVDETRSLYIKSRYTFDLISDSALELAKKRFDLGS